MQYFSLKDAIISIIISIIIIISNQHLYIIKKIISKQYINYSTCCYIEWYVLLIKIKKYLLTVNKKRNFFPFFFFCFFFLIFIFIFISTFIVKHVSDFHNYARHDVVHSEIDTMFLSVYSIFICLFVCSQIITKIIYSNHS